MNIDKHPCFNNKSHFKYGRMHLAVAPKCNVQCVYCDRKYDCANESRPGVTSRVLDVHEAIEYAEKTLNENPVIKVIGIAGPGDPLANEETFQVLEALNEKYKDKIKCVSTNGLLLPKYVDRLYDAGVEALTVTLNTIDIKTGAKLYSFINYEDITYKGEEGAKVLLDNQLKGIELAVKKGMTVKVNTVVVPDINHKEITDISKKLKELGVFVMNINSVIPAGMLKGITALNKDEIIEIRREAKKYMNQFECCNQCRADAVGIPALEKRHI